MWWILRLALLLPITVPGSHFKLGLDFYYVRPVRCRGGISFPRVLMFFVFFHVCNTDVSIVFSSCQGTKFVKLLLPNLILPGASHYHLLMY